MDLEKFDRSTVDNQAASSVNLRCFLLQFESVGCVESTEQPPYGSANAQRSLLLRSKERLPSRHSINQAVCGIRSMSQRCNETLDRDLQLWRVALIDDASPSL